MITSDRAPSSWVAVLFFLRSRKSPKCACNAAMHCLQSCDQPPSTGSSAPVVKVASNARKRTAFAISSDVPKRFIGTHAAHLLPDLGGHVFIGERFADDRRVDGTGRHRVDANLARKKLSGEHPSE